MPKSVEVLVYSFAELSDKAKDKAHYEYLSSGFDCGGSDNIDTIESFCELFNIALRSWRVDSYSYSYDATIPAQRCMTKKTAIATVRKWEIRQGYCLAYSATQAMEDAENWRYGDLKYMLDQTLDAMFKACRDDYEYQSSIESFAELCDCNEWQFLEDGGMFHA